MSQQINTELKCSTPFFGEDSFMSVNETKTKAIAEKAFT